jgi:hypothetical protein
MTVSSMAVRSVDAGALRYTSDRLGRPEGTLVHSRVTPAVLQAVRISGNSCCSTSFPRSAPGVLSVALRWQLNTSVSQLPV